MPVFHQTDSQVCVLFLFFRTKLQHSELKQNRNICFHQADSIVSQFSFCLTYVSTELMNSICRLERIIFLAAACGWLVLMSLEKRKVLIKIK